MTDLRHVPLGGLRRWGTNPDWVARFWSNVEKAKAHHVGREVSVTVTPR